MEVTGLVSFSQQVSRLCRSCKTFLSLGSDLAVYRLAALCRSRQVLSPDSGLAWRSCRGPWESGGDLQPCVRSADHVTKISFQVCF